MITQSEYLQKIDNINKNFRDLQNRLDLVLQQYEKDKLELVNKINDNIQKQNKIVYLEQTISALQEEIRKLKASLPPVRPINEYEEKIIFLIKYIQRLEAKYGSMKLINDKLSLVESHLIDDIPSDYYGRE